MAKTKNRAPGATGNPAEEETNCKNNSELRRESQDIKAAAIEYLQVGLSVIPVNPESKMTTLKTWKPYQKAPMMRIPAKSATCSERFRPPVPEEVGRLFRLISATYSGPCRPLFRSKATLFFSHKLTG